MDAKTEELRDAHDMLAEFYAGFATVFWGGRAAQGQEGSPQGYLIARQACAAR
jgi:hypothetical protein